MNETKHTPVELWGLDWECADYLPVFAPLYYVDPVAVELRRPPEMLVPLAQFLGAPDIRRANAELALRAVKAHGDLLATLKELAIELACAFGDSHTTNRAYRRALHIIQQFEPAFGPSTEMLAK